MLDGFWVVFSRFEMSVKVRLGLGNFDLLGKTFLGIFEFLLDVEFSFLFVAGF